MSIITDIIYIHTQAGGRALKRASIGVRVDWPAVRACGRPLGQKKHFFIKLHDLSIAIMFISFVYTNMICHFCPPWSLYFFTLT